MLLDRFRCCCAFSTSVAAGKTREKLSRTEFPGESAPPLAHGFYYSLRVNTEVVIFLALFDARACYSSRKLTLRKKEVDLARGLSLLFSVFNHNTLVFVRFPPFVSGCTPSPPHPPLSVPQINPRIVHARCLPLPRPCPAPGLRVRPPPRSLFHRLARSKTVCCTRRNAPPPPPRLAWST